MQGIETYGFKVVINRVGSAAEFSWPLGGITGFRNQGNLVRKKQKKTSVASPCSRGLAVSWSTQRELRRTGVLVASRETFNTTATHGVRSRLE